MRPNHSLTDVDRPFFITGQVQRLRWEGKVDAFGIKALHDLGVDPGGVVQIFPVIRRMVPVDDQDVKRVGVEFAEGLLVFAPV